MTTHSNKKTVALFSVVGLLSLAVILLFQNCGKSIVSENSSTEVVLLGGGADGPLASTTASSSMLIRHLNISPVASLTDLHLDNAGATQVSDLTGSGANVVGASPAEGNLARSFVQDGAVFFNTESLSISKLYPYDSGGGPEGGPQVGWETVTDKDSKNRVGKMTASLPFLKPRPPATSLRISRLPAHR